MVYFKIILELVWIMVSDAPYQDNPTTCTWLTDLRQTCKISFHANTNVTVVQIIKNGEIKSTSSWDIQINVCG